MRLNPAAYRDRVVPVLTESNFFGDWESWEKPWVGRLFTSAGFLLFLWWWSWPIYTPTGTLDQVVNAMVSVLLLGLFLVVPLILAAVLDVHLLATSGE